MLAPESNPSSEAERVIFFWQKQLTCILTTFFFFCFFVVVGFKQIHPESYKGGTVITCRQVVKLLEEAV